jgi:hypothetical protein
MPRLPETHHSTTASARAFHVKKNSAAMAPTWNAPIKKVVIQLTGCVNVLSRLKILMISVVLNTVFVDFDYDPTTAEQKPL